MRKPGGLFERRGWAREVAGRELYAIVSTELASEVSCALRL